MRTIKTLKDLKDLKIRPVDATKEFRGMIRDKFGLEIFLVRCGNNVIAEFYNPKDYEKIDTDSYGSYLHYIGTAKDGKVELPYNCKTMLRMFDHVELKKIDLSDNDLSEIESIREAFRMGSVEEVHFGKQPMSNLLNATGAFMWCSHLKYTDIGLCTMKRLRTVNGMFYHNKRLESIDLSAWKDLDLIGSISMFGDCSELKEVIVGDLILGGLTLEKASELLKDCPCLQENIKCISSSNEPSKVRKVVSFE